MLVAGGKAWPEWAAVADLRWHVDQGLPIPGRPELQSRWRWAEWPTRQLLKDEPRWWDPSKDRAAYDAIASVRSRAASASAAKRQASRGTPSQSTLQRAPASTSEHQQPNEQSRFARSGSPASTSEHQRASTRAVDPPPPSPAPIEPSPKPSPPRAPIEPSEEVQYVREWASAALLDAYGQRGQGGVDELHAEYAKADKALVKGLQRWWKGRDVMGLDNVKRRLIERGVPIGLKERDIKRGLRLAAADLPELLEAHKRSLQAEEERTQLQLIPPSTADPPETHVDEDCNHFN